MVILTDSAMSTNLQHLGHITNMECFIVESLLECRNGVCVCACVCVCVCVCVCLFHLYALLNMQINASPWPGRTKRIGV
jgi:hypothetical protein